VVTERPMRGMAGLVRDLTREVSQLCGLLSSVRKNLGLFARSVLVSARQAPAPVMASLLLGIIAMTYFISQAGINGEVSEVAKYSEAKWEKVHLNFNQTKVVLITGDTRMGEVLGRLVATAKGVHYWDSPLKFCWEKPKICLRELGSLHSIRLLESLFHCQLRFLAVFQDWLNRGSLEDLVHRCSTIQTQLVRSTRLRVRDVAFLMAENPHLRIFTLYLLRDPRASLADIKTSGKFRERGGGPVKIYGNSSYKTVIQDLCALVSDDIEHLAGKHVRSVRVESIRQEDLLLDLQQELRQVLRLTGLRPSKATEEMVNKLEFPDVQLEEKPKDKVDLTMAEELEAADRWKNVLSPSEIQFLERDFRCNQVKFLMIPFLVKCIF